MGPVDCQSSKKKLLKFQATMCLEIWGWIQIAPFCSHHLAGGHILLRETHCFWIWNTIVEAWPHVAVYKPLQKRICHIETERKILSAHWSNIQHIQMCSIIVVLLKTHIHTYICYLLHSYLGMYMRCISEMKELPQKYQHPNV